MIDAAGAVQYISPAAERILGHALTSLAGANVFEYVHPDDRQRVVDTFLANKGGMPVEPTIADWLGYVKCSECGRVYDHEGIAVSGPGKVSA